MREFLQIFCKVLLSKRRVLLSKTKLSFLAICLILVPENHSFGQAIASNNIGIPKPRQGKESKTALKNILKQLESEYKINFHYDEDVVNGVYVDREDIVALPEKLENSLLELLKPHKLKFKKISDAVYVIQSENPKEEIKSIQKRAEVQSGNYSDESTSDSYLASNKYDVASMVNAFATISGKVTSETGDVLPGVSVVVKGTTIGTVTDVEGGFTLSVPDDASALVFSFIGYSTEEVLIESKTVINVRLVPDVKGLQEVVVTALGIRKERKSLGYSVTEVQGESLTQARENNVVNSLVGKVAGLNVGATSGGAGSSSNVIIRGVSSISQDNQPLYVVNGIPMESAPSKNNTGSQWDNGPDLGDAISNLNPDDIESISVLKGAAASALYGYRAKAGVILITTKGAKGNGIEFNSNFVGEQVMDRTDWQYVYGQGTNNKAPLTQTDAAQAGQSSWGAKLDGSNVIQFDGQTRPYVAKKDNLENFYRTGSSWTNTLAFNKSFEKGSVRLSASNLTNKAVVPNSGLDRQTFNLAGTFNPTKRLSIEAKANYILEQVKNRAMLSDGAGNANYNVAFLPTTVDVNDLKQRVNADGSEYVYTTGNIYATNPWFAAYDFVNNTNRERFLGSINARYTFDNGFFIQGRAGRDSYSDRYKNVLPFGTAYYPNGKIIEQTSSFSDLNIDGLIGKSFKIKNDFTITPNLGASYRRTKSETITNNGADFSSAGVYVIKNARNKSVNYIMSDMEVQSVYGTLEFSYKGLFYLTGSTRADWFSTLASKGKDNDLGVFYPSVSGSFVYSELIKSNFLSFGKLRMGYAVVGQATQPFKTQLGYEFKSEILNGKPLGGILNPDIPNSSLRASIAKEFEIGTEAKFFKNRIGLDLTYYNKISKDEIVSAPISSTTGYSGAMLNSGEMRNKGFEALINISVISTDKFSWTTTLNGAINENKIISLGDMLSDDASLILGTSRSGVGFIANVKDESAAQILAYDYKYDEQGNILYTTSGIPQRGELKSFGSAYHKWTGGWNNEFSYKGINLGILIDGKFGGKIFSATDYYGYQFGLHKETLVNREGTWGNDDANKVNAATYYSTLANNVSKLFVEDASFIKLRQITLGYTIPSRIFKNKIQSLTISVVGRNLGILMKKTDNIDPEASYNAGIPGLELGGVPPVRTFGVNLNVKL